MLFVCLQEAGLREGDYIVAIDGQDCKWAKHGEVVNMLKSCSDRGVELSVVTLHSHESQVSKCVCVFEAVVSICMCKCDRYFTFVFAGRKESHHAVPLQQQRKHTAASARWK